MACYCDNDINSINTSVIYNTCLGDLFSTTWMETLFDVCYIIENFSMPIQNIKLHPYINNN